jgi:nicotinate-nucleotide adenylyltransferase
MLTPDPPHKQGLLITPIHHRLAMVELTLAKASWCEISRIELDRPGPHYALDTVHLVGEQFPGAEMIYIMGADSLVDLPTWHCPNDLIMSLTALGVMRRPGADYDLTILERSLPGIASKLIFIKSPPRDISGTEIRMLAVTGRSFRRFVLPSVYEYIIANQLYSHPQYQ